jgi:Cytochrome C oxidase, cbb3-type, subunit III
MKLDGRTQNHRRLISSSFFTYLLSFSPWLYGSVALIILVTMSGCVQQMASQPHLRPLERSAFFEHGQASRPLVPGTVPSGYTRENVRLEESTDYDPNSQEMPFPLTREVMERGHERFDIYCAACHARTGTGDGPVVLRGFSHPPSFHTDALRAAPLGHFYDVMTKGFGAMPSYAVQIPPRDRWAIAAYIRALQLSQHATVDDIAAEYKGQFEQGGESTR